MVFNFFIGGFFGTNCWVKLEGDTLYCLKSDFPRPMEEKFIPCGSVQDNPEWEALLQFLAGCRWERRYDSGILDGTQWELKVKTEKVKLQSYGSNAYPAEFKTFQKLLNQITGKAGVRI
ncbi:hypothetical protein BH24BAC1_BH24BAC1_06460 [soil metagenome]|jgi:hypothetical protein